MAGKGWHMASGSPGTHHDGDGPGLGGGSRSCRSGTALRRGTISAGGGGPHVPACRHHGNNSLLLPTRHGSRLSAAEARPVVNILGTSLR